MSIGVCWCNPVFGLQSRKKENAKPCAMFGLVSTRDINQFIFFERNKTLTSFLILTLEFYCYFYSLIILVLRANLLMKEIWKVVNNVQKRIIPMIFHQTITYCVFSVVKDVHVVRKSNHCYYNYLEVYIILTFFFLLFFSIFSSFLLRNMG